MVSQGIKIGVTGKYKKEYLDVIFKKDRYKWKQYKAHWDDPIRRG